jgi:hypothetical protein
VAYAIAGNVKWTTEHPFDSLSHELISRIICELDSADVPNLIRCSRQLLEISQDSHVRLSFLCAKYDKADRMFELLARPRLCNRTTLDAFLNSGRANLSRYFAQILSLAKHANAPRWTSDSAKWGTKLSMESYLYLMERAFKEFGEFSLLPHKTDGVRFQNSIPHMADSLLGRGEGLDRFGGRVDPHGQ